MSNCSQNRWIDWNSALLCLKKKKIHIRGMNVCPICADSLSVVVVVILMAFLANLYPLRQLLYGYPILLYGVMLSIACACLLKWEETGVPGGNPCKHGENIQDSLSLSHRTRTLCTKKEKNGPILKLIHVDVWPETGDFFFVGLMFTCFFSVLIPNRAKMSVGWLLWGSLLYDAYWWFCLL